MWNVCGNDVDPEELYREFQSDVMMLQEVCKKMIEQRLKGRWQAVVNKASVNEHRCTAIVWDRFKYNMLDRHTGRDNDWTQVTLRSTSAAATTTTFVSMHLPHGGDALDVFASYIPPVRVAATSRMVWAGDLNVELDGMDSGNEETDARMSMVRGFIEARDLQKRRTWTTTTRGRSIHTRLGETGDGECWTMSSARTSTS